MGINISDINPDHLPEDVCDDRTRKRGLKINFIDCSIDKNTKERLFNKLKTQYGAIEVENHDGIIYYNLTYNAPINIAADTNYLTHGGNTRVKCPHYS